MQLEAAYLAGIFDGEGSICASEKPDGNHKLCVAIANRYKPLLDSLKETYGGVLSPNNDGCWQWRLNAADEIFVFLNYIRKYTIIRAQEIAIALAINSTTNPPGKVYTDQELLVRERLFSMLADSSKERKKPYK